MLFIFSSRIFEKRTENGNAHTAESKSRYVGQFNIGHALLSELRKMMPYLKRLGSVCPCF